MSNEYNLKNNYTMYNDEPEIINPVVLEKALKPFNWGAFGFGWLWGLGNGSLHKVWWIIVADILLLVSKNISHVKIALFFMAFFAFVKLVLSIYFGFNGNKWAFHNRAWWSMTDFEDTQYRWAVATGICAILMLISTLFRLLILSSIHIH